MDVLRQRLRIQPQAVAQAVTSQRFFLYAVLSTLAVVGVIANACRNYSNFYSVAIYLGKSGRSVVFLANFCCLVALLCGKLLQRFFFGPLQPREVERLYDQTWMFVTESLLAFTIFRDEFDIPFGIMFGFLLFVKCFHWLMADRMESMDQIPYPGPNTWFHVRMQMLFVILWVVDFVAFTLAIETTLQNGVGGTVLFANEYAILMASALNSMAKYGINVIEFRRARANGGENAPPWEDKSMHIFYIELVTDFMKLITYLSFFAIIVFFYGLPLNMIRDVYLTARSFITRFRALSRYRTATRDMDRRYPNATDEELAAMSDRTCIICRDELVSTTAPQANDAPQAQAAPNTTPKKLPCGHVFHFNCLRSWLERQQSCPTCRRTVLETNPAPRPAQQPNANPAAPGPFAPAPGLAPAAQQQPGWMGRFINTPQPPGAAAPNQQMGWPQYPQHPPAYPPFMYPYQPPQLQPPPVYPGFYGPGGGWNQWGLDAQQPHQPQPQAHQQQQPPSQQPPTTGTPTTPSETSSAPPPAPTATSTAIPSFSSSTETQRASTPRDAALSAALRRLNAGHAGVRSPNVTPGTGSAVSSPSGGTATSNGANTSPFFNPNSALNGTDLPNGSTTASPSTPTPTAQAASRSTEPIPPIPRLIPLTDFHSPSQSPFFNQQPGPTPVSQGFRVPSQSSNGIYSAQWQQTIPGQSGQTQPTSRQFPPGLFRSLSSHSTTAQRQVASAPSSSSSSSSSSGSGTANGSTSPSSPRTDRRPSPLSQLPSVLSDEQLLRMADRLTREAIDERLRVLGNVDAVVNRCIDELTRMRSVLPPGGGGTGTGTGSLGSGGFGMGAGFGVAPVEAVAAMVGVNGAGPSPSVGLSEKGKAKEKAKEVEKESETENETETPIPEPEPEPRPDRESSEASASGNSSESEVSSAS